MIGLTTLVTYPVERLLVCSIDRVYVAEALATCVLLGVRRSNCAAIDVLYFIHSARLSLFFVVSSLDLFCRLILRFRR